MLEIKHTLCPSCSVGCGINVVLEDGEVVGTFPYKRHPVNAGKNCLNGRNSIDCYKNKFESGDAASLINDVSKELNSANSSDVTVICSGNNTMAEIEAIKEFAESRDYNIAFFADNLKNVEDVASYDDVENFDKIFVIGDVLYENPLIGRRIVHAKQNGAQIFAYCNSDNKVIFSIADECFDSSVDEFLDANKGNIDESSLLIFNQIDSVENLDTIDSLNCKLLPVFSKSNTKGVLDILDPKSEDEMVELLQNTKVLLVFDDNIVEDIDFDFSKISKIISFAPCENETTKISDIVVPIKTWLEKDGSFVNAMGTTQDFNAIVESDVLSEIEIIEKLKG
jgi:formate dehydrogenase major subunit